MEPSKKSPKLEEGIKQISGVDRIAAIRANRCVDAPIGCGKPVTLTSFRDNLSRKEYAISGLCQECQDTIWGKEGNDTDNTNDTDDLVDIDD